MNDPVRQPRNRPIPTLVEAPYANFAAPAAATEAERRILIVKRGAFGDILAATPLLDLLRQTWPNVHITWIAGSDTAALLAAHTDIDELVAWDGAWWRQLRRNEGQIPYLAARLRFIRALRARRFDLLISLEAHEMAWIPFTCGAPRRVGLWARGIAARGYQTIIRGRGDISFVEEYLSVGQAIGLPLPKQPRMSLPLTLSDRETADRLIAEARTAPSLPLIAVHPKTNWQTKDWPLERFAAALDEISEASVAGINAIVTGLPDQIENIERLIALCRSARPLNAAGKTRNVRELAAVIAKSDVVLSGDTSAMHIAAAVGTPCVTVFGPTAYSRVAPPPPARLLPVANYPACAPCSRSSCSNTVDPFLCLRSVAPEPVAQAVLKLLRETNRNYSGSIRA